MALPFHVFLSHSSPDKPAVEALARRLRAEGLEPWLDLWNLVPGAAWQPALEQALAECVTCAVFIGPGGFGPWQNEEMRAAISRRVAEGGGQFRVIPVLLPGVARPERSKLPAFLVQTTWVEFRDSVEEEAEPFRRLVAGIRGLAPGPAPGEAVAAGVCPYRGLEVFDVPHAQFFFGREALVEWLVTALRPAAAGRETNRFLAIVGASGSGKSSLARAGLVVALARGAIPGSEGWPVAICRPGPDPLESLAVALTTTVAGAGELINALGQGETALHLHARLALAQSPPERRLVVLVDQFEEVFTRCSNPARRDAFLANLLHAARVAEGRTVVVLTMRADFYGKCAAHAELSSAVSDHHLLVGPMTDDELRRAIERPAQLAGAEFEPGLVDLMLRDAREESGGLPLLQHALLELWERHEGRRLTSAAYREIGGLAGALEKRANSVLEGFNPAQREICRRLFLRLTQPGEGTEDTKRRAPLREILASGSDPAAVETVVQKLTDARLLTTEGGEALRSDAFVEVAHEALIRSWPQLRQWLDADRSGLRTHRRLTEAAGEWAGNRRDASYLSSGARLAVAQEWSAAHPGEANPLEAEFLAASTAAERQRQTAAVTAARRRTALAVGVALAALLLLALTAALYFKSEKDRQRAEHQTRVATAQALASQATTALATHPQRALLLAVEALHLSTRAGEPHVPAAEQALRDALANTGGLGLAGHRSLVNTLAISPDARWLVTGSEDHTARLWDLRAADPAAGPIVLGAFATGGISNSGVRAVAFSPDGRWLATGGEGGPARLWDLAAANPAASPVEFQDATVQLRKIAFSADGRWLAAGGSTDAGSAARLWRVGPAGPMPPALRLPVPGSVVGSLAFSGDSRWLATGSAPLSQLWNLTADDPAAHPIALPEAGGELGVAMAFSADSRRLAATGLDGKIRLWDLLTPPPAGTAQVLPGNAAGMNRLELSRTGDWLATAGSTPVALLWKLSGGEPIPLRGHEGFIHALTFGPEGNWIATGGADHQILLWGLGPEGPISSPAVFRGHEGTVTALAASPDRSWLASASEDGTARLWKDSSAQPVLRAHPSPVTRMAISPDGQWLATSAQDRAVRFWDLRAPRSGPPLPTVRPHDSPIVALAISPDGRWLATACQDGTARLWPMLPEEQHPQPIVLRGHTVVLTALAFSPDSRSLATASADGTARVWDLTVPDPAAAPAILAGHENEVLAVAFSADSRWLATGSQDRTARVWDLRSKGTAPSQIIPHGGTKVEHLIAGYFQRVSTLALSPDGRWLATGGHGPAKLWDLQGKEPAPRELIVDAGDGGSLDRLTRGIAGIAGMLISPDGRWLAVANGGHARLFDLRAPNPASAETVLRGHRDDLTALAVSADGRWLVTGSLDKTARLWDLRAPDPGAHSIVLQGHAGGLLEVAISADQRVIATRGSDGTIRLWPLPISDLVDLARITAGRNFSLGEWSQFFPGQPYRVTFPELPRADQP